MAGMRKSNKKKVLKMKDGESNLHFPSCTPDVQAGVRETRRTHRSRLRDLSDEMGWYILRRDNDYVSVPAKYKSRLVGCGNFKTTEGRRTDSPAGEVDSHTVVCSWCAQALVSTHPCDFTNGYFQGQEIDRISLHRIPAEGIPEEGIAGREIWASRVPVCGTKEAGRGLWLRLKHTCKQFKFH